ncbi:MAG: phenylacetate--CoA ligase family protein [Candidatus Liptonbacteria bacterium]|nr:phenylacetate--CoA ligase family protein [Candidatus Liptonbacteria bacterium]
MRPLTKKDLSADKILHFLKNKKSDFWSRERENRPLKLFHEAAHRVPAYKDFLRKHRVDPAKIKTFKDFELLPTTDKKSYLREYPLEKLAWDGHLNKPIVYTSTSGSTGEPFYFPREQKLDWQYSILAEEFLKNSSYGTGGPTLVIVGFGMGVWIGGIITYKAFEIAAQRSNLPVSIITPGTNKSEIFHALRNIASYYNQVILIGYPPFIKDLVDEAPKEGINLKKINLRILFAAESFSEKFRDYIIKKTNLKNPYLNTLNIYGTADIGAMAYETPTSILVRRLAMKSQKLFKDIFHNVNKTPTLAEYNPFFITFEAQGEDILLTGDNTIPLIRYSIGDHGGVMSFSELDKKLKSNGIDLKREARKIDAEKNLSETPFVYVYERKDLSTKLYGAIIYPEHIREALQHEKLETFVTGKFTLMTKTNKKQNQFMEVHVELKPKIRGSKYLEKLCHDLIVESLLLRNAEYRNNYSSVPHKIKPKMFLWPHGHHLHFKPGIKQKWVKKENKK